MPARTLVFALALLAFSRPVTAADHVFVVNRGALPDGPGSSASFPVDPPWVASTGLETVGTHPTVRHAAGFHLVVNGQPDHTIQLIDPVTFDTIREIDTGAGSDPEDVLVLEDGSAYVSRRNDTWLLRVDLATGARLDSIDLAALADADGVPEMARMARDGERLFVQIQRVDMKTNLDTPPSYVAVVDLVTRTLVDVDVATPGTQGIALVGPIPTHDMVVLPNERRLYLSTPGHHLDGRGGIEVIDLDGLVSLGHVVAEIDFVDIGCFAIVSAEKGYLVGHTDIIASSHLVAFSPTTGEFLSGEIHFAFGYVNEMVVDPVTERLYFPDAEAGGVSIFDTSADTLLTAVPISVGGAPVDVAIVREDSVPAEEVPIPPPPSAWRVAPNPVGRGRYVTVWPPNAATGLVRVVDARGRTVRTLTAAGKGAGIRWDVTDDEGRHVAPGVYWLSAGTGRAGRLVVAE